MGGIEGIWLTMPPLELSEEMMVTDYTTNITKILAPEVKQMIKMPAGYYSNSEKLHSLSQNCDKKRDISPYYFDAL